MTLEENVMLCHGVGTMAISAILCVEIPNEFVMDGGPNNVRPDVARDDFTLFNRNDNFSTPPPLSTLAATWDVTMATRSWARRRVPAKDMILGLSVNMMRTTLCGRNFEYRSKDPKLVSALGTAYIRVLQFRDVAACFKYFTVNNQELNRGAVGKDIAEHTLRKI